MFSFFWSSTVEPASPPPSTSSAALVSTPYASRKTTASASAWMLAATISWLAALTVWPEPFGPTWTTVLPTTSKSGLAASKSSASPPTMIDSAAFFGAGLATGDRGVEDPEARARLACSASCGGDVGADAGEVDDQRAGLGVVRRRRPRR